MLSALGFGLLATGAQAQNLDLLKEGAKIKLVLSGVTCDVRVMTLEQNQFVIQPLRASPGCATSPSVVPMSSVVRIDRSRSLLRSMTRPTAGIIVGSVGLAFASAVAVTTESAVASLVISAGAIAAGILVGKTGYRTAVFLNVTSLTPVSSPTVPESPPPASPRI